MVKEILLFVLLGVVVLPGAWSTYGRVKAQEQGNEVLIGISIKNPYNVPVYFRVRHVNGSLVDRKLAAGTERTYHEYDQIWIYSENGNTVHYRLEKEGRYVFYWEGSSQKWDLRKRK